MTQPPDLRRFLGLVLVLLLPSFVLWMTVSPWLSTPVVLLCDMMFTGWMPEVVAAVQLEGSQALVTTHFGELDGALVAATQAGYQMGYHADVRLLSYSIPFYAALHFATPQSDSFSNFSIGVLILYPLIFLGLTGVILKDLMLGLGELFFQQSAIVVPGSNVIGIFYQLSTLIVPPVSPILVWAWQSRNSPLLQQFSVSADAA